MLLVPLVGDVTILFRYCALRALAHITVFYKVFRSIQLENNITSKEITIFVHHMMKTSPLLGFFVYKRETRRVSSLGLSFRVRERKTVTNVILVSLTQNERSKPEPLGFRVCKRIGLWNIFRHTIPMDLEILSIYLDTSKIGYYKKMIPRTEIVDFVGVSKRRANRNRNLSLSLRRAGL